MISDTTNTVFEPEQYSNLTLNEVIKLRLPFNQLLSVIECHNADIKRVNGKKWRPELFMADISSYIDDVTGKFKVYSPTFGYGYITVCNPDGTIKICFYDGTARWFDRFGRLISDRWARAIPNTECTIFPSILEREWTMSSHSGSQTAKAKTKPRAYSSLIERDKASEVLGICERSISNYIRYGLLHEIRRNKNRYLAVSEVLSLIEFPELNDVEALREGIDEIKTRTKEEYTITKEQYEERRQEFTSFFKGSNKWDEYKKIIDAIARNALDSATPRQREVFNSILNLKSKEEIAEELGISYERVRQLFVASLSKIEHMRVYSSEQVRSIEEENKEMKRTIETLQERLYSISKDNDSLNNRVKNNSQTPFALPVDTRFLNGRARYILKRLNIETYGDLASYKREELLSLKNVGATTVSQLGRLLNRYNLKFGMWRDPNRDYRIIDTLKDTQL